MNNSPEAEQPSSNDRGKQERTLRMQRKVLEHLTESGNVSYSCKRAGVSRETYYTWKEEDEAFERCATLAINYGKSYVNDLAHTHLIANIQKGDIRSIEFQLKNCHKDYQPRRARPPGYAEDEEFVPVTTIIIGNAPSRLPAPSPSPSPAPSAAPERDKKKPKPASPSAPKPSIPPVPEIIDDRRFQRPRIWGSSDNDDGFEIDSKFLWGPRR